MLFLPGLLLSLGGGAIFGAALGCLVVWAGAVLGETLAFLFGRCALCLPAGFTMCSCEFSACIQVPSEASAVLQAAAAGLAEDADEQVPSLGGMLPSVLLGPLLLPKALAARLLRPCKARAAVTTQYTQLQGSVEPAVKGALFLHRRWT